MFLLDTNVVSELRRPSRTDAKVAAWADSVPPSEMSLSSITVLELETGALLLSRRDPPQGTLIRRWIENRYCRHSPIARYRSILPSPGVAPRSTSPIPSRTEIR